MRKFMIILIFLLNMILVGCSFVDAESEYIVETEVGNLTKDDFYEVLKDRYGEQVLKEMIITKVLEDQFNVTEEDVEERVKNLKDSYGDSFESFVEQNYSDINRLRETLKFYLLQEEAVFNNVEITEEQLKERYERSQIEIDAQHIVVISEEIAKEVKTLLDEGEDFESLAAEYSKDDTAYDGGHLGYFSAGRMVKEFEDAVYRMEPGEISDPVETQFGFHIIKVNDRREVEGSNEEFSEVKEDIHRELVAEQVDEEKIEEIINEVVSDALVSINIDEFIDLFQ